MNFKFLEFRISKLLCSPQIKPKISNHKTNQINNNKKKHRIVYQQMDKLPASYGNPKKLPNLRMITNQSLLRQECTLRRQATQHVTEEINSEIQTFFFFVNMLETKKKHV